MDIEDFSGGEVVLGAVYMASEGDAAFIDLDIVAERKGLESATIGQKTFFELRKSL